MTPDEMLALIRAGEGQRVEFKSSFAEEKKAIESLCAFANADGGCVVFGVTPDGEPVGASIGNNTLKNFANRVARETQPPLYPIVEVVAVRGKQTVAATVERALRGQLFYAFNRPCIRVGRTNKTMSPEQQKARLLDGSESWSDERDRPRFSVTMRGAKTLETDFSPMFGVEQFSGDPLAAFEWRIRGPRFAMDWRHASGSALSRTSFTGTFDLSVPAEEDDKLASDEMGFEVRFSWRRRWRSEIHRWPLSRRALPKKVLWDIGEELLPPMEVDQEPEPRVAQHEPTS